MASWVYGGKWGPGSSGSGFKCVTRARVRATGSVVDDDTYRVKVEGATCSGDENGNWYLSQWTVNTKLGHNGGGGVSASSTSGSGRYDYGAWVGALTKSFDFPRKGSAYKVTFYFSYDTPSGSMNGKVSTTVSIPKRDYDKPNPPKSLTAARVSDVQMKLAWKGDYTNMDGARPWTGVYVERSTDGGSWKTLNTVDYDDTSYIDRTTGVNHAYKYGLRSNGPGGTSERVTAPTLYTTPAQPSSVTLAKVSGTVVEVSADTSGVRNATSYEVERSVSGGDWEGFQSFASLPQQIDAGGGKVKFRVRSARGDLKSAWVESAEIATLTPPLAPALSGLPAVAPTGSIQSVTWIANHPDGTAQSAAEVEVTVGGSVSVVEIPGSVTRWQVPEDAMGAAGTVSVRVRTKGLHADWGAWSSPMSMVVAVPPSVTITSPGYEGYVVDRLPMVVEWDASDVTGIASQLLELIDHDGVVVYTARPSSGSHSIGAAQHMMADNAAYTIRITVTGGSSLSSSGSRGFETRYAAPAVPQASCRVASGLSMRVSVESGMDDGAPETVAISVVRVMPDGGQWLVEGNMMSGDTCNDPLPPLNIDYSYLVTAYSEIGTASTMVLAARVDSRSVAFNWGPSAGEVEMMMCDPSWSRQVSRKVKLYDFADGGEAGGLPMAYTSAIVESGGSQAFTMLDLDQMRRIDALASRYAVCWYRDLYGGRRRCAVAWSLTSDVPYGIVKASADLTDVRFEEAW